jgi:hypothetical protein
MLPSSADARAYVPDTHRDRRHTACDATRGRHAPSGV